MPLLQRRRPTVSFEQQPAVRPERRAALREHGVVERPQRELRRPAVPCSRGAASASSACRPSTTRYVGSNVAALRLAPRGRLLEERLVAEEAHPLLHRQVLAVQADGDDEPRQPHERLGELPELEGRRRRGGSPASTIICSQ